jgi:hypothetical protein
MYRARKLKMLPRPNKMPVEKKKIIIIIILIMCDQISWK